MLVGFVLSKYNKIGHYALTRPIQSQALLQLIKIVINRYEQKFVGSNILTYKYGPLCEAETWFIDIP